MHSCGYICFLKHDFNHWSLAMEDKPAVFQSTGGMAYSITATHCHN